MAKTTKKASRVTRDDVEGQRSLQNGIYSRRSSGGVVPAARITKGTGDLKGDNNPHRLKSGLLGKQTGYGRGKANIAENPLGLQGGMLRGRGIGVSGKKPNFLNNPIGYVGGLLINRKAGRK